MTYKVETEKLMCGHPVQCISRNPTTQHCLWCAEVAELERKNEQLTLRAHDEIHILELLLDQCLHSMFKREEAKA